MADDEAPMTAHRDHLENIPVTEPDYHVMVMLEAVIGSVDEMNGDEYQALRSQLREFDIEPITDILVGFTSLLARCCGDYMPGGVYQVLDFMWEELGYEDA